MNTHSSVATVCDNKLRKEVSAENASDARPQVFCVE